MALDISELNFTLKNNLTLKQLSPQKKDIKADRDSVKTVKTTEDTQDFR